MRQNPEFTQHARHGMTFGRRNGQRSGGKLTLHRNQQDAHGNETDRQQEERDSPAKKISRKAAEHLSGRDAENLSNQESREDSLTLRLATRQILKRIAATADQPLAARCHCRMRQWKRATKANGAISESVRGGIGADLHPRAAFGITWIKARIGRMTAPETAEPYSPRPCHLAFSARSISTYFHGCK